MEQRNHTPSDPPSTSMPDRPAKRGTNVPVPVVVGVFCLGLGMVAGIVVGQSIPDHSKYTASGPPDTESQAQADALKGKGPGGKAGSKGGKGNGKGVALGGPKGGGPSPKAQLAQLVAKLDTLTAKPLTIQFSPEKGKQVHAILTELGTLNELNNDEAKVKLDALLKLLEDHKDILMAAGFAWPGARGEFRPPGAPAANANIFRLQPDSDHLKALEDRLGK